MIQTYTNVQSDYVSQTQFDEKTGKIKSDYFVSINKLLEIVERLNHNGSISIKLFRKELKSLKENKQE